MTDSGPDGPSFDPRRWGAAKPDEAKPAAPDPTFDPKAWAQPKSAPRQRKSSSGGLIAGVVAVAVLVGAGVTAFVVLGHRPAPPPPKVVTVAAQPVPAAPAGPAVQ